MALSAGMRRPLAACSRVPRSAASDVERAEALLEASDAVRDDRAGASSFVVLAAGLVTAWAQGYAWFGLTTGWMLLARSLISLDPRPAGADRLPAQGAACSPSPSMGLASAGEVTPELRASLADPTLRAAHVAELAALAIIVALMVLKPF